MNRADMINYISETYGVSVDYPFLRYPDTAVFRHQGNKKWFAAIINVDKSKLGLNEKGKLDIINLKCDPILAGSLRNESGVYPAYHMNKTNWVSVTLDGSADNDKIKWILDMSFELTAPKIKPPSF